MPIHGFEDLGVAVSVLAQTLPEPQRPPVRSAQVSGMAGLAQDAWSSQVCAQFCSTKTQTWTVRCSWKRCGGCSECSELPSGLAPSPHTLTSPPPWPAAPATECRRFCAFSTGPWEYKCTWDACRACSACSTPPAPSTLPPPAIPSIWPSMACAQWCNDALGTWELKCSSAACAGCADCEVELVGDVTLDLGSGISDDFSDVGSAFEDGSGSDLASSDSCGNICFGVPCANVSHLPCRLLVNDCAQCSGCCHSDEVPPDLGSGPIPVPEHPSPSPPPPASCCPCPPHSSSASPTGTRGAEARPPAAQVELQVCGEGHAWGGPCPDGSLCSPFFVGGKEWVGTCVDAT